MDSREDARAGQDPAAGRETAVLFAGVAGTGREDNVAEEKATTRVAEMLAHASRRSNGRVASRLEREVMALFATPDAALRSALRLHAYALTLPPLPRTLGMRISLHYGPVAQRGEELFGDTVKHALALLRDAAAGEALISGRAASALSPSLHRLMQRMADGGRIALDKALHSAQPDLFAPTGARSLRLRLAYGEKSVVRRRHGDAVTIGTDAACDIAVSNGRASQRHCTILRGESACVLKDHSDRGTYVTVEGGAEVAVRGEEFALSGRGLISFGRPANGGEVVRYVCEG